MGSKSFVVLGLLLAVVLLMVSSEVAARDLAQTQTETTKELHIFTARRNRDSSRRTPGVRDVRDVEGESRDASRRGGQSRDGSRSVDPTATISPPHLATNSRRAATTHATTRRDVFSRDFGDLVATRRGHAMCSSTCLYKQYDS